MVTITYVADKDYPFADSSIGNTYTVTYSATDIIYLLSGSSLLLTMGLHYMDGLLVQIFH